MRNYLSAFVVTLVLALAFLFLGATTAPTKTITRHAAQTIYITNNAPSFISDKTIIEDIPAWEDAVNKDFAGYWHTTQFKLVFLGRQPAPSGSMSAVFDVSGPIKGALAYHWTERGNAPSITVYAGTGAYYGFNNSVSFTHELFELAADPVTSAVNQGYPYDYYWLESKNLDIKVGFQGEFYGWFQEVADPVEADSYTRPGRTGKPVKISDFITPAWFNDGVGSRYDFMGLAQQPFWIRPGGYAQYLAQDGWHAVLNFRKGHASDAGFRRADPDPSEHTNG